MPHESVRPTGRFRQAADSPPARVNVPRHGTDLAPPAGMAAHDSPTDLSLETQIFGDRRDGVRVDVLGQVQAHSVWRLRPILLREMSGTGFSIEATGAFETGALFKFRLGVEGHRRSMVVQARAMHCTLLSATAGLAIYVVGFELVDATDAVRREMQSLVRFAQSMWLHEAEQSD
jgi:hypothetical protein